MPTSAPDGRRSAAAARRRARESEIIAATRELFDERGVRDAQIEDIARAVGINRAIVYRHFTGKEELFALTLVGYLDELRERLAAAAEVPSTPSTNASNTESPDGPAAPSSTPVAARLTATIDAFVTYGLEYPAFADCAQSLMRRTGPELLDELSEGALLRLGRAMTGCLTILTTLFDQGNESGEFDVSEPALLANMLYASGLGALQLARVGILVSELAPGVPTVAPISADQVRDHLVSAALAQASRIATTP